MAKFETCSDSPRFVTSTIRTIAIASLFVWPSNGFAQISQTLEVDRDTLRIGGYENLTEKAERLAFEGRLIAAVAEHEKCKDYAEHEFDVAHWAVVEARHHYDQAVQLGELQGPEREVALQLYSNWQEGLQADRKGNRAEASRRCSLALENASRLGQDDTIVVADILITLEMQLESDEEKAKALRRIVSIYGSHRCELDPTAIAARIKLAEAHLQKDILQAESEVRIALSLLSRHEGIPHDSRKARVLRIRASEFLGTCLHHLGAYEEALIAFKQGLPAIDATPAGEVGDKRAALMLRIAHDNALTGRQDVARAQANEILALWKGHPPIDKFVFAGGLVRVAEVYVACGQSDQALSLLDRAEMLFKESQIDCEKWPARYKFAKGRALAGTGAFAPSRALLNESLRAFELQHGAKDPGLLRVLQACEEVARKLGHVEEADTFQVRIDEAVSTIAKHRQSFSRESPTSLTVPPFAKP